MKYIIPKNIRVLALVSFFNDIASEMIYPVVPLFLITVVGAPVAAVGIIEGIAEATVSLLRVASGWFSDKIQKRKMFVVFGYFLATVGKVVIGFAQGAGLVLAGRFLDKVGKGTRTAPRDALITDSTPHGAEGTVFGFHRMFDTMGAVLGPLITVALLASLGGTIRPIFFIAAVPAIVGVVLLVVFVQEPTRSTTRDNVIPLSWDWKKVSPHYKLFLVASIVFSLGNSSDAFLILRADDLGLTTTLAILAYATFNAVYALLSYPLGRLSDRIGADRLILVGFALFAVTYTALGSITSSTFIWFLFPLYGVYMALTDGIGRAFISEHVPRELAATAFGIYQGAVGLCILVASTVAGFAYEYIGSDIPFLIGGFTSSIATVIVLITFRRSSPDTKGQSMTIGNSA